MKIDQGINRILAACVALLLLFAIVVMFTLQSDVGAQQIGEQNLLKLRFVNQGVSSGGAGILQTGDLANLSASVATATLTRLVVAPASGQTYVKGVVVEKATASTGSFTLQYGTGTNCGTGTTVLIGPVVVPPIQEYYLGFNVPAGQDLCAQTDAATTVIRILYS